MKLTLDQVLGAYQTLSKVYTTSNTEVMKDGEPVIINMLRAVEMLRVKDIVMILEPMVKSFEEVNKTIVGKYAVIGDDGNPVVTQVDGNEGIQIDKNNVKIFNAEVLELLKESKDIEVKLLDEDILNKIDNLTGHELNFALLFVDVK